MSHPSCQCLQKCIHLGPIGHFPPFLTSIHELMVNVIGLFFYKNFRKKKKKIFICENRFCQINKIINKIKFPSGPLPTKNTTPPHHYFKLYLYMDFPLKWHYMPNIDITCEIMKWTVLSDPPQNIYNGTVASINTPSSPLPTPHPTPPPVCVFFCTPLNKPMGDTTKSLLRLRVARRSTFWVLRSVSPRVLLWLLWMRALHWGSQPPVLPPRDPVAARGTGSSSPALRVTIAWQLP